MCRLLFSKNYGAQLFLGDYRVFFFFLNEIIYLCLVKDLRQLEIRLREGSVMFLKVDKLFLSVPLLP